ncbi:DUF4278 domain-containing protein [Oscillatoria sp. CS-180]|uniref:DUF4278 domain-containing protein n=1 Tax=Oscillatoria sp. CS-180 TaxID=3021720 RepID=UPI00232B086F|nr:DUF4278 domain-containing protein [Oscillatoria sp. CS-180]MDB9527804.1 DUF4278 domain-containing protein [Oscillatoria sp. CS-180]
MELKYRGIAYRASSAEDQTTESDQAGLSRRRAGAENKSIKKSLRKPSDELIYRGVRYTQ